MQITNDFGLSLSVAAWLVDDSYDHNHDPNTFSTTELLKSTRQIVLSKRIKSKDTVMDVSSLIASTIGNAIHDGINSTWMQHYVQALHKLGHSAKIIDKIRINPKPEEVVPGIIPIYAEQRTHKILGKYTVSGKYDFIGNGKLEDFKSTTTFTYVKKSNDLKFQLQGSIYRWLNPEIITDPEMLIQYIFLDWSKNKVTKDYPPSRILAYPIQLLPIKETEIWLANKLIAIEENMNIKEPKLPECTAEELWRSASVFAYYKNPQKTTRSSGNFNTYHEAHAKLVADGSVGTIIERTGQVRACAYCNGYDLCTQKDAYLADGSLVL